MIGFKYTSLSTPEIFDKISYISETPMPGIIYILCSVFFVLITINFIFPFILFSVEHFKKESMRKQKSTLMKQIILQKELEDEIEESFIKSRK